MTISSFDNSSFASIQSRENLKIYCRRCPSDRYSAYPRRTKCGVDKSFAARVGKKPSHVDDRGEITIDMDWGLELKRSRLLNSRTCGYLAKMFMLCRLNTIHHTKTSLSSPTIVIFLQHKTCSIDKRYVIMLCNAALKTNKCLGSICLLAYVVGFARQENPDAHHALSLSSMQISAI